MTRQIFDLGNVFPVEAVEPYPGLVSANVTKITWTGAMKVTKSLRANVNQDLYLTRVFLRTAHTGGSGYPNDEITLDFRTGPNQTSAYADLDEGMEDFGTTITTGRKDKLHFNLAILEPDPRNPTTGTITEYSIPVIPSQIDQTSPYYLRFQNSFANFRQYDVNALVYQLAQGIARSLLITLDDLQPDQDGSETNYSISLSRMTGESDTNEFFGAGMTTDYSFSIGRMTGTTTAPTRIGRGSSSEFEFSLSRLTGVADVARGDGQTSSYRFTISKLQGTASQASGDGRTTNYNFSISRPGSVAQALTLNDQTIKLKRNAYYGGTRFVLQPDTADRPLIERGLRRTDEERWFARVQIAIDGEVFIDIVHPKNEATHEHQGDGDRLTDRFEQQGSIYIAVTDGTSHDTITFSLKGTDVDEPYFWFPDNATEVGNFARNWRGYRNGTIDACVVISDGYWRGIEVDLEETNYSYSLSTLTGSRDLFAGTGSETEYEFSISEATGRAIAPVSGDALPIPWSFSTKGFRGSVQRLGEYEYPLGEPDKNSINSVEWNNINQLLDTDLIVGGATAYLRHFHFVRLAENDIRVRMWLSSTLTEDPDTAGPNLVDKIRATGRLILRVRYIPTGLDPYFVEYLWTGPFRNDATEPYESGDRGSDWFIELFQGDEIDLESISLVFKFLDLQIRGSLTGGDSLVYGKLKSGKLLIQGSLAIVGEIILGRVISRTHTIGSLTSPASTLSGRLKVGIDTPLAIRAGTLRSEASTLSGRLHLRNELDVVGSLTGAADSVSGRLRIRGRVPPYATGFGLEVADVDSNANRYLWSSDAGFKDPLGRAIVQLPTEWFAPGTSDRTLNRVILRSNGEVEVRLGQPDQTAGPQPLTSILIALRFTIVLDDSLERMTLTGLGGGTDITEPFRWTPDNSAEVVIFYQRLRALGNVGAIAYMDEVEALHIEDVYLEGKEAELSGRLKLSRQRSEAEVEEDNKEQKRFRELPPADFGNMLRQMFGLEKK